MSDESATYEVRGSRGYRRGDLRRWEAEGILAQLPAIQLPAVMLGQHGNPVAVRPQAEPAARSWNIPDR